MPSVSSDLPLFGLPHSTAKNLELALGSSARESDVTWHYIRNLNKHSTYRPDMSLIYKSDYYLPHRYRSYNSWQSELHQPYLWLDRNYISTTSGWPYSNYLPFQKAYDKWDNPNRNVLFPSTLDMPHHRYSYDKPLKTYRPFLHRDRTTDSALDMWKGGLIDGDTLDRCWLTPTHYDRSRWNICDAYKYYNVV